jgi:hypothetical protein
VGFAEVGVGPHSAIAWVELHASFTLASQTFATTILLSHSADAVDVRPLLFWKYERHRVSLSLAGSSSLRRISANRSGTPSAMIPEYIPRNSWPIAAMTLGPSAGADLLWSSSLIAIGNALCALAHTGARAELRFLD